ncbi:MAG: glycosyl transferase family 2 [Phycisphaerales bacterium]|nr:glycosyl transferase family 2 [Phycisphaerales bacterium]
MTPSATQVQPPPGSAGMPLVSIIVITYNDAAHVCEAVDSALAQTYPNCEVIVSDDGSTDGTPELIARKYGDKVRYHRKANGGMGSARAAGLDVARGEMVQHLDSDDLLFPDKIRLHVQYLQSHPQIAMVYGKALCFYDEDKSYMYDFGNNALARSGHVLNDILVHGNWVVLGQPLFRREWIDRVGGWDRKIVTSDDYDITIRLAYAGAEIAFLDGDPVFLYRQRRQIFDPTDPRTWRSPQTLARAELYVLEKLHRQMVEDRRPELAALDRRIGDRRFVLGKLLYRAGQRREGLAMMWSGLRRDRRSAGKKLSYIALAMVVPGPWLLKLKHKLTARKAAAR